MRCLSRNKRTFYYALYQGKTEVVDSNGNKTGQKTISYSSPVAMTANISSSKGTADVEMFGINENYTKTIVTDDMACPIKEDSILWIDKAATVTNNDVTTVTPHNYVVVRKAVSLNSIVYAIREVKVG